MLQSQLNIAGPPQGEADTIEFRTERAHAGFKPFAGIEFEIRDPQRRRQCIIAKGKRISLYPVLQPVVIVQLVLWDLFHFPLSVLRVGGNYHPLSWARSHLSGISLLLASR